MADETDHDCITVADGLHVGFSGCHVHDNHLRRLRQGGEHQDGRLAKRSAKHKQNQDQFLGYGEGMRRICMNIYARKKS